MNLHQPKRRGGSLRGVRSRRRERLLRRERLRLCWVSGRLVLSELLLVYVAVESICVCVDKKADRQTDKESIEQIDVDMCVSVHVYVIYIDACVCNCI